MDFIVVAIYVGTQTRKETILCNTSVKTASFKKYVGAI